MPIWTLNDLFLINAAFLLLLGGFLVSKNQKPIAWMFLAINISLASWNFCIFLIETRILMDYVSWTVKIQLLAAMCLANGLYYFCDSYPIYKRNALQVFNYLVFGFFGVAIFSTNWITRVEYDGENINYLDGVGYVVYSIYLSLLGVMALWKLVVARKNHPEYADRIRYFFAGIGIFEFCAIVFNLILPSIGNYDFLLVGRLSATAVPLLFFYAITKHEFLDVTVIINKATAWVGAVVVFLAMALLLEQWSIGNDFLHLTGVFVSVVTAALLGKELQNFLLTTAKRKFIRGWYSSDEVLEKLSRRITMEKNREALFNEVKQVLDEVFELEEQLAVVAVRDENNQLINYRLASNLRVVDAQSAMLVFTDSQQKPVQFFDIPEKVKAGMVELGLLHVQRGVLIPFHSPEFLEGVLVLGSKGDGTDYNENDMRLITNVMHFVMPLLYRLTPLEKLEKLYIDNKQKLHEAEIQLIRAQKIESIVHATRQCHHEIRTPLNIIKLGIGRIKSLEELENFKSVAKEEITHALEIVEETLAISDVNRSETKRKTIVNVNDVIRRCLRLIDTMRYKVAIDLADVPEIEAYFSDLQVVITNLIHNALDAMPDGGSLAFSTRSGTDSVVIVVEDSGEGIPDDLKSRVWEPYFSGRISRVGNSTARRGWGLTIVNRIVDEHGGTIRFDSERGAGTRFTISIPLPGKVSRGADNVVPLSSIRR